MPPAGKASSTGTTKSTKPDKRGSLNNSATSVASTDNGNNNSAASFHSSGNNSSFNFSPGCTIVPKSILKTNSVTNAKTHNKKISFHNKKKTKRIPNLNSMPEDILQDIWWAADDYDEIMRSFEYTVFMMEAGEHGKLDAADEHCTRGLELRTEAGKWERFEHKRDCYNAVLDEQDRQWNAGEENQEKIANCCREVTAKTQRMACRKGMQDEKDIVEYVADTRALLQKNAPAKSKKSATSTAATTAAGADDGTKSLPSRSKSNSTGQLKRRTPRTDSGKARMEKSPPRKPERVLSSKSERDDVDAPAATGSTAAPRTPRRSPSGKSGDAPKKSVTPTNSATKTNLQRIPQRQTFSNNSNAPAARSGPTATTTATKDTTTTAKTLPPKSNSAGSTTSSLKKKTMSLLPKMPKRSTSSSSTVSKESVESNGSSTDSGGGNAKGKLNSAALAKFGG